MQKHKDEILLRKIARQVKQLRESKGVSQETVFIDTDIHCGRVEAATHNITISTLKVLCDYFNVSLSDFFIQIEENKD